MMTATGWGLVAAAVAVAVSGCAAAPVDQAGDVYADTVLSWDNLTTSTQGELCASWRAAPAAFRATWDTVVWPSVYADSGYSKPVVWASFTRVLEQRCQ